MRRPRLTSRSTTTLLVVVGLGAAACGQAAEVLAPRVALREAVSATASDPSRFTMTVTGTDDDLAALFLDGEEPTADDERVIDLVTGSKLVLSGDRGDDLKSCDDDRSAIDLDLGGIKKSVQLVTTGKVLYLRADVKGLAELFEAPPGTIDEVVDGASEAGFDFIGDAVAGEWLTTDLAPLESMMAGMAEAAGGAAPAPAPGGESLFDCELSSKFASVFGSAFSEDVSVERKGSDDSGDRYLVTVPIRKAYEKLLPALGGLPGFSDLASEFPSATEIPDKDLSADVWISDGRISRGEIDIRQFAELAGETLDPSAGPVRLRVDVDRLEGGVDVPKDAVTVDLVKIFGQFMGGFGAPENFEDEGTY